MTAREGRITGCSVYREGVFRCAVSIDLADGDEMLLQEHIESAAHLMATTSDRIAERRARAEARWAKHNEN